eukprot:gnl/MRDRNA2_/MRDRNA2_32193_c0_seq1.p1 gnl/MRDRNA2_/MRDRNA2_32193_c0~~gnl/MRDRNA2_/MRDRNA2_32193_c0_seq1.p1  ORF type:complete len:275 (+),score=60.79 gnl/MRDRNA2_/MRDRNA2_32193_c0_seq1:81-827(+)
MSFVSFNSFKKRGKDGSSSDDSSSKEPPSKAAKADSSNAKAAAAKGKSTLKPVSSANCETVNVTNPVDWRPRDSFETIEGFVNYSMQHFVHMWSLWLNDGTLKMSKALENPSVAQVILSKKALDEAKKVSEAFGRRLSGREKLGQEKLQHLVQIFQKIQDREYAEANKSYVDLTIGNQKWQLDVPYLVEGNKQGPSVVMGIAEKLNKSGASASVMDDQEVRAFAMLVRRLLTVIQAARPNSDPSKNVG